LKSILEAIDLHTYYGESHILHGISLKIHKGETIALIGRNGMGKTTLLRTLIGLTPPRSGKVTVYGKDTTKMMTHKTICQGLAFVPEDRGIFPNLSVLENLTMAERESVDGQKEWDLERVLGIFPLLEKRISNMGNQLSGGEQQMLTVGRALMTNPDLILLDEATEGLAPLFRLEIWSVIRTIKEAGIAAIVVDKDIKALLKLADKSIVIEKGTFVYEGESADLRAKPEILHRYLGV
jgi:branched-chain amino acid transport system ATP-binding protein